MPKVQVFISLALLAVLGAPAGVPAAETKVVAKLAGQNSTQSGVIRITQQSGNLLVELKVAVPAGVTEPVELHKGSCTKIDAKTFMALQPLVNGTSTTTLSGISLAKIREGTYAVVVHASATDLTRYVSCGDVGRGAKLAQDVDFNGFGGRIQQ